MFNEWVWKSKLLSLTQSAFILYKTLRGCITNGHACEYLTLVHITLQEWCVHFSLFKWYKLLHKYEFVLISQLVPFIAYSIRVFFKGTV